MARMAEAAGFPAGYLGGGSTGYQKVALDAGGSREPRLQDRRRSLHPAAGRLCAVERIYAELADGFGANVRTKPDWSPVEKDMLAVIDLEKLLAIERATVEDGTR